MQAMLMTRMCPHLCKDYSGIKSSTLAVAVMMLTHWLWRAMVSHVTSRDL